jgi:hypothetical protein
MTETDNKVTLYDDEGNPVEVPEDIYRKHKLVTAGEGSALSPTARRCTARAKHKLRAGLTEEEARCDNPAVTGWTVCRMHGARGGRPLTRGKYSRYVPSGLGQDIDRFLSDPRILSLQDNIAVADVHIQELLTGMSKFIEILERGLGLRDAPMPSSKEISFALQWEKSLKEWVGERRMLAAEERRLMESQSRMMSMDKVAVFIAVLADSVKRNVSNPDEVAAIGRDLSSVLGRMTGTSIGPEVIDVTPRVIEEDAKED